jgi:hypothetical protein
MKIDFVKKLINKMNLDEYDVMIDAKLVHEQINQC